MAIMLVLVITVQAQCDNISTFLCFGIKDLVFSYAKNFLTLMAVIDSPEFN